MSTHESTTTRLAFAGASALTVLAWYALPDAVRSRRARTIIKAGLLGVTAAGAAMIPQVYPDAERLAKDPVTDLPSSAKTALFVGTGAIAIAATIWGEKAIYARGERIRAAGVRCAHTPAAAALALTTGAFALVDWPGVVRRLRQR